MRPEVIAFRELNTLVRNLTDQLAGYRRRALASEARAKELEEALERMTADLAVARTARAEAEARADRAELHVGDVFPAATAPASESVLSGAADAHAGRPDALQESDIARENERLRSRLGEARDRTVVLVERVRFLRQQLSQGAER